MNPTNSITPTTSAASISQTMTPQDFAAKIRAKYPGAYDSISDVDLTNKVIAKYPTYRSQVDLSAIKPDPALSLTQNKSFTGLNTKTEGSTAQVYDNSTPSLTDAVVNTGKSLINGTLESGKDITAAVYAPGLQKQFDKLDESDRTGLTTILALRQKAKAAGQDTTHYDNLIKNYQLSNHENVADVFPALKKSNEQVIGDFASMALELISSGSGLTSAADRAAATASTEGLTLGQRVLKGTKVGAGYGAGFGVTGALQNNESAGGIAESGIIGAGTGAILGGATDAAFGKRPSAEQLAAKDAALGEKAINQSVLDVMPHQTKDVRIDELRNTFPDSSNGNGGVSREGILGKSTPQPTAEDIKRGQVAHEYIKDTKDPVEKIANVNQAIRDNSENVIKPFLEDKAAPANFEDMRGYIEANNKPTPGIQKDPTALESYNRATENALSVLDKTMRDTAEKTGDYGPITSGNDIRNARIAIDKQITEELGKETFGTPQYKGIKAAEINTRNILNRLNEDMLRYPGQLDKLNKMNDFINEAQQKRGIKIDLTDPEIRTKLENKFGLEATKESEAAAQFLADQHEKLSHLYDARDNMIEKYQTSVGKNKFQEFLRSPKGKLLLKAAKITGIGAGVLGGAELFK